VWWGIRGMALGYHVDWGPLISRGDPWRDEASPALEKRHGNRPCRLLFSMGMMGRVRGMSDLSGGTGGIFSAKWVVWGLPRLPEGLRGGFSPPKATSHTSAGNVSRTCALSGAVRPLRNRASSVKHLLGLPATATVPAAGSPSTRSRAPAAPSFICPAVSLQYSTLALRADPAVARSRRPPHEITPVRMPCTVETCCFPAGYRAEGGAGSHDSASCPRSWAGSGMEWASSALLLYIRSSETPGSPVVCSWASTFGVDEVHPGKAFVPCAIDTEILKSSRW